jgi:hypothetical protein
MGTYKEKHVYMMCNQKQISSLFSVQTGISILQVRWCLMWLITIVCGNWNVHMGTVIKLWGWKHLTEGQLLKYKATGFSYAKLPQYPVSLKKNVYQ